MSVGEELVECPLCMEPLDLDDINFFPCTCGYQICRFCWHRIRTDENGLCPACRKQYPEDPAQFKPLTDDELQRIKKERRQKDVQRKQKAAENRKHLANVRVVQRNLVFVVGLSQRLADTETLKKHDYFGKFGKMHKVVINQNTSYAGAQVSGPSASAYVTYTKPEDALKAIQAVNNCHVDGRTLKASLGTTKYCSHFLRGSQCPKPDCMYLHELGEEAASFTKEEMQQGKHQEYEQKLYEQFMNSQNLQNHVATSAPPVTTSTATATTTGKSHSKRKTNSPPLQGQSGGGGGSSGSNSPGSQRSSGSVKDGWPSLSGGSKQKSHSQQIGANSQKTESQNAQHRAPGHQRNTSTDSSHSGHSNKSKDRSQRDTSSPVESQQLMPGDSLLHNNGVGLGKSTPTMQLSLVEPHPLEEKNSLPTNTSPTHVRAASSTATPPPLVPPPQQKASTGLGTTVNVPRKSPFDTSNSMSLFSSSGFAPNRKSVQPQHVPAESVNASQATEIPDTISVSSCTDWQAAFGFTSSLTSELHDDDLGFDPWNESSKALADLMAKENLNMASMAQPPQMQSRHTQAGLGNHFTTDGVGPATRSMPPGFQPNSVPSFQANPMNVANSKVLGLIHPGVAGPGFPTVPYHDVLSDSSILSGKPARLPCAQPTDTTPVKDWQDGLRALLPNINISFGAGQQQTTTPQTHQQIQRPQHNHLQNQTRKSWLSQGHPDPGWDPAIVTSGNISDPCSTEEPHWMASLQHLTEESSTSHNSSHPHRLPYARTVNPTGLWAPVAAHPPPGFAPPATVRPHHVTETHKLAEGLQ